MNLTAIAMGEPAVHDFINYVNFSAMADGLVGGSLPNVIFYFPIIKQNFSGYTGSRYWTMIAAPVSDMKGGREQDVWFRFHQVSCAGEEFAPPCKLHGEPQYYDTYWYSNNPITKQWIVPDTMATASGFYTNLLDGVRFWNETLAKEGMMELELPSTPKNNGSWLVTQATHAIIRSMISRDNTWHGRYGVLPGYGISLQDGFEDTFTATATGSLEFGAVEYARGVINNHLLYYVRNNGMTTYRAEELAQSGRMLTIFALYVDYTRDDSFMLGHFTKARALATWLVYRWNSSLTYPANDPTYGIPPGGDEGDGFIAIFASFKGSHGGNANQLGHMYSCAGGIYRGFEDAGRMWVSLGTRYDRPDVTAHGKELLAIAPKLRAAIQASMAKTSFHPTTRRTLRRCWPSSADPGMKATGSCSDGGSRSYPELFYSGILTSEQVDDIYTTVATSNNSDYGTRPMTLGAIGYNNKQVTFYQYGMAYGLLQHDMVERFLLHYFGMSAHTYTRGTWTTPEASHPDRDVASTDYVAAGVMTAPTYLKWMLVFEEPDSRTVWLAKALPRDWLAPQTIEPVIVRRATTRYGRVSYSLKAKISSLGAYVVSASVHLPDSYNSNPPPGGVRLRLRAPAGHAGKLKAVTVGGRPWTALDPAAETIDFAAAAINPQLMSELTDIVATFA